MNLISKWLKKRRDQRELLAKMVESKTPQHHSDYWYCGDWCITKKRGVSYFYKHKYVDYRDGDLMTLPKTKFGYPIYRVMDWTRSGSDNASFDDGRHYELEFVRFQSKPKLPTKKMLERP